MGKGADATGARRQVNTSRSRHYKPTHRSLQPRRRARICRLLLEFQPSDEYDGDVAAEPGIAVDKEAGAFRVSLAVSTDEKGLLGFTMEQPSNEVLKMRADAPCAKEGLLQLGDQIEGMDGVELHQASAEKVPGSIKRLLVVRYDEAVADALLIARPALESTAAMPGKEPLELLRTMPSRRGGRHPVAARPNRRQLPRLRGRRGGRPAGRRPHHRHQQRGHRPDAGASRGGEAAPGREAAQP